MADNKTQPKTGVKTIKPEAVIRPTESSTALLFFQRYFYYIVASEALIILLLGYLFVIRPQVERWVENAKQKTFIDGQIKTSIVDYDQKIEQMQSMSDGYAGLSDSDINDINALLPDAPELESLFTQINKIVRTNGLILNKIGLNDTGKSATVAKKSQPSIMEKAVGVVGGKVLKTLNFNIELSGVGYRSLKNVLTSFENNLRIIDINEIEYNPKSESVKFNAVVYYLGSQVE